ncbi:MAG: efflux RND transporter periplasmic adaptor subunit [Chromatiales bacterium]|jgi:HlyD family secretion protein|nr:efflux RND transporter periplasmic adaptor subunit [Chromatiales bacterium]
MNRRWPYILALLATVIIVLVVIQRGRGPVVAGYQLQEHALVQQVVASGRVVTPSRVQVGSEITGVILERRVREGDRVVPGDVLLVMRADELEARAHEAEAALKQMIEVSRPQAKVAAREADARLAQSERETQRRLELHARHLIASETLEAAEQTEIANRASAERAHLLQDSLAPGASEETQLRARLAAARAALDKTIVHSQIAGTVLTRNAEPGDLVQPGRTLLEIARDGDTEILLPVDEKNLAILALGQHARCIADAFPERVFDAEITFIAPSIDPQRGTIDVRLRVAPVPDFLRQDMTVSVTIETGRRDHALAAPNDTLTLLGGARASVMTLRDGRTTRAEVTLGLRGLTNTEIVSGLAPGDWVIINNDQIDEGKRVRVQTPKHALGSSPSTRRENPIGSS